MSKMANTTSHIRHCILYEFQQDKSAAQASASICSAIGDNAVTKEDCEYWFSCFRSGNFELTDSNQSVANIQGGQPRLGDLSEELKKERILFSLSLLTKERRKSFLWKIVTGDRIWINFDDPERTKLWLDSDQQMIDKFKDSDKTTILCIYWDIKGVLYYEFLSPTAATSTDWHEYQLVSLNLELYSKRPWHARGERTVKLLVNREVIYTSEKTMLRFGWDILGQPINSPDLSPTSFHVFRAMKGYMENTQFETVDDIRSWIDEYFDTLDHQFFRDGMHKLPERWLQVIQSNGECLS